MYKCFRASQGMQEKTSFRPLTSDDAKQQQLNEWEAQGVKVVTADVTDHADLIPALRGTDYLVSCTPLSASESQYPLIWAAKEAGVERFVPSEFGFIYDWEQSLPTDTVHRDIARQKVFIRKVIELAGLDYTIIPAGLWPEFYLAEPISVMGDGNRKFAWSVGPDVGRIIPHVLASPATRNAVCPVAATFYCSWNELIEMRENHLGRKLERNYLDADQWKGAYAQEQTEPMRTILAIGVAATECPEGMPLWANWNAMHLPDFKGTPAEELFPNYIEPFIEAMQAPG